MPPESIPWERKSREYVLMSDLGDQVVFSVYRWVPQYQTYMVVTERVVPTYPDSDLIYPHYERTAVN